MANEALKLYNFYRRYKWTAEDFEGWQGGMVDHSRGMFEGLFGGAVLEGFAPTLAGGLDIDVSAGIASGPTGFLNVVTAVSSLSLTAPSADFERALVVVRPNLTPTDMITKPTDVNTTVSLTTEQRSEVAIIRGSPASSPAYPATEANDVILFGVRLEAGQVTLAEVDLDFEVRDLPGKNSNFQQDMAKFDDRLRPYRYGNETVGLKPSQLSAPFGRVFSYVQAISPSIFPKDSGGEYNHSDTFLNMTTGAITGGDEASVNFTPTIPSAGNAIVACIGINTDDEIEVSYGNTGNRTECLDAIKNQKTTGNGSVQLPLYSKPIAFVICFSDDGANITEIDVIDCRGVTGFVQNLSGIASNGITTPGSFPLTLDETYDGKVIFVDTTASAKTIYTPTPTPDFKFTIVDIGGYLSTNKVSLTAFGGVIKIQGLKGLAATYELASDYGSWTFMSDGTDWFLI